MSQTDPAKAAQDTRDAVFYLDHRSNFEADLREMRLLLTLFVAEHLVLCAPMIILNLNIDARNEFLEEKFPPTADEIHSTSVAKTLAAASIAFYSIIPMVQVRTSECLQEI